MANMYKDAIQCQDACNLSGVLKSWARHLETINAQAREQNADSTFVRTHPVNVLFADKLYSLTGYGSRFAAAYEACKVEEDKPQPATPQTDTDKLRAAMFEALKVVNGDNTRQASDVLREQWERLLGVSPARS